MKKVLTFYLLFVSFDGSNSAMPKPKYDKNMGAVVVYQHKSRYEVVTDSLKKAGNLNPDPVPAHRKRKR